jgi:hypothetical protein
MILDRVRQVLAVTFLYYAMFHALSADINEYRFLQITGESAFWLQRVRTEAANVFCAIGSSVLNFRQGRVAEWLMAPVLKTGVPERVSGVRIPPLPPFCLRDLGVAIGDRRN